MRFVHTSLSAVLALGVLTSANFAVADDDDPPKKKKTEEKPAAKVEEKAAEKDDGSEDHSKIVGKFGVSYFGQFDVPITAAQALLPAQLVGVRYWLNDGMAIDGALGLSFGSASSKAGGVSTDAAVPFVLALKFGVPLKMTSGKHYTFFIAPEAYLGIANRTDKGAGGDTAHSGTHLVIGARAGAEIQFGFIGIPHLALDASVGLGLDYRSGSSKPPVGEENSSSALTIATQAFNSPWNIFTSNVAARYYF